MSRPKIVRYNNRYRGQVESRKKISQRQSIRNAIQDIYMNVDGIKETVELIKISYGDIEKQSLYDNFRREIDETLQL